MVEARGHVRALAAPSLAALVVAVALAGCAGDAETPETGGLGGLSRPDGSDAVGNVTGMVLDDAGRGIPGARVSSVGTSLFTTTIEDGTFAFAGVRTGDHLLRAEKTGYSVAEAQVTVLAGDVVQAELILIPDARVSGAFRDHVHDYWGPSEELVIMDEEVALDGAESGNAVYSDLTGTILIASLGQTYTYAVRLPEEIPDEQKPGQHALIYPGTATLRVQVEWTQEDATFAAVLFGFCPTTGCDDGAESPELASGSTWDLEVQPGWADNGHQLFTHWQFWIRSGHDVRELDPPAVAPGTLHLTMTVVKGAVPLEPPHPRFWANGTELLLRDPAEAHVFNIGVQYTQTQYAGTRHIVLPSDSIVPPGTTRMRLDFCWDYGRIPDVQAEALTPWSLTWLTADQDRWSTPVDEYRRVDPVSAEGNCKVYEFPVEPAWTDAFYQKRSLWRFWPQYEGLEDEDLYAQEWRAFDTQLFLGVTAFNDDAAQTEG